jgi:hypothetical protein
MIVLITASPTHRDVAIKDRAYSGGNGHTLATLTNTGDTSLRVLGQGVSECLFATLTTMTNCTDMDVTVEFVD